MQRHWHQQPVTGGDMTLHQPCDQSRQTDPAAMLQPEDYVARHLSVSDSASGTIMHRGICNAWRANYNSCGDWNTATDAPSAADQFQRPPATIAQRTIVLYDHAAARAPEGQRQIQKGTPDRGNAHGRGCCPAPAWAQGP